MKTTKQSKPELASLIESKYAGLFDSLLSEGFVNVPNSDVKGFVQHIKETKHINLRTVNNGAYSSVHFV